MKKNSDGLYIIAEMASSHQGNVENVYKLIDKAITAQAHCVQLQIFDLKENATTNSKNYKTLEKLEIEFAEWKKIIKYVEKQNIEYSVFTYDENSLSFVLENFSPNLIKFNSSELSNPKMLEMISRRPELPLNLGTGGSTIQEIHRAVRYLNNLNFNKIYLAHGLQNFPTDIYNINFYKMKELMKTFDYEFIYCDHTDYRSDVHQYIDYVALGIGIKIFEKHYILKNNKKLIDNESSLSADNLEKYVKNLQGVAKSLSSSKSIGLSEKKYRQFQKKSTILKNPLKKGEKITLEAVSFKRDVGNKEGIDPFFFLENYNNKKINKDKKANSKLNHSDFDK